MATQRWEQLGRQVHWVISMLALILLPSRVTVQAITQMAERTVETRSAVSFRCGRYPCKYGCPFMVVLRDTALWVSVEVQALG